MSTEKFVYTEEVTGEIVNIPVKLLHHHHANPRGQNYGDLSELTASIKANGILQNLTVVPFWFDTTGVGCDDPKQQTDMGYLVVIGNRPDLKRCRALSQECPSPSRFRPCCLKICSVKT